jgi:hypothetical protein
MRISGVFAPHMNRPENANGVREAPREGRRPRRLRIAYALAVAWVVTAFVLYTFQLLKLVGALG